MFCRNLVAVVVILHAVVVVPRSFAADAAETPASANPAGLEHFEKKVRPILIKQCYKCHSAEAESLQGGLYVDSREGLLEGGDSGPAVVVGSPSESLLIEAIKHESFEMPPEKQLPDDVIAEFELWIRSGLADPRERPAGATKGPRVLYSQKDAVAHWAFQSIKRPSIPSIDDPWVQTPVDAFVLERLRGAGLQPSPLADRRTLLRRASYDLTGIPPSLEAVESFEADRSSDAFSRGIDRLLASPHYGEKWGRHWLDLARYSDTNGQRPAPTPEAPFYPFAWVYRDYVVDAFNRDLPFDRFIREQLAGDSFASESNRRPLAGLGFLRVGQVFGQNVDDRIDDRIDATAKAFLGLTVACARCHDHKLDPIYQSDYYALHGVFASSEDVDSLYLDTSGTPEYDDYMQKRERLIAEIEAECLAGLNEFMHGLTLRTAEHMVAAELFRDGKLTEADPALAAREVDLLPIPYKAWLNAMTRWDESRPPAMLPWFAFAALPENDFSAEAPPIAEASAAGSLDGVAIPALVARHFKNQLPQSLRDVAEIYQSIFLDVERKAGGQYPMAALLCAMEASPGLFRKEYLHHPALPPPLEDPELEALRQLAIGFEGPFFMTPREMMQVGAAEWRKAMVRRKHEVTRLEADHLGAPIKAMVVHDAEPPVDTPIYIRGDKNLPGGVVPRRFLRRLSDGEPQPFSDGSGRRELADAIASRDNPLTARVIVNRVWQWHFGVGLVSTPSDFGLNGQPPTHPELLDWLAAWFMDEGWSIKRLHRLIMNSSVYQQSSLVREECLDVDPDNALLWRMNPRRLTFEELRDSLLLAAGRLDPAIGGRPVDPLADASRRSVYLTIDRYDLPTVFNTFDFASPEFSTAERDLTIVPQQALFLMNHPWVMERARDLAVRASADGRSDPAAQVGRLYEIVLQRAPRDEELQVAVDYLRRHRGDDAALALDRLAHALLQLNEVMFVE